MKNYDLAPNEVILYNDTVDRDDIKGRLNLTLTSKKIIFEQSKVNRISIFKSETKIEIVDTIDLENIKVFNGKNQIQQKGNSVYIQTIDKNFTINFDNKINTIKFLTKINDAITKTTLTERGSEKVKETLNKVDDVLGINTRDTIKGVLENGIAGSLLKGVKKNKN